MNDDVLFSILTFFTAIAFYIAFAFAMVIDFPDMNSSTHPKAHERLTGLGFLVSVLLAICFVSHYFR